MTALLTTERLELSELQPHDVTFVFELFNDPDCIRFIGDRGMKTLKDAELYLKDKLIDSYRKHGFGLYKVTYKNQSQALGICGLVKRDEFSPPDIGFAFLPAHRGGGICTEAGQAILDWVAMQQISPEILAYTNLDNEASIRVLEKLGLKKQTTTVLAGQDHESLVLSIGF